MKPLCSLLFATLAVVGAVVPAHAAARLVTARLTANTGDSAVCNIVNAGTKTIKVTVAMVNFDGTIVGVPAEFTLDPDESTSISAGGFRTFYCRYTGLFAKQTIRASAAVHSDLRTIVSVPAE